MARAWIVLRNQVQWPFRLAVKIEPRCRTLDNLSQINPHKISSTLCEPLGRPCGRPSSPCREGLLAPPDGSYRADINNKGRWTMATVLPTAGGTIDTVEGSGPSIVILVAMIIIFGAAAFFTGRLYGRNGMLALLLVFSSL